MNFKPCTSCVYYPKSPAAEPCKECLKHYKQSNNKVNYSPTEYVNEQTYYASLSTRELAEKLIVTYNGYKYTEYTSPFLNGVWYANFDTAVTATEEFLKRKHRGE